ncbi:conjugal transfer protein TraF [Ideonella sp. YS5]|uniref:conjugal transfer protein TraF n=1 Tax=Ideonella sp. YS5 TaxID=3453714 RepID=UPI003EEB6A94
MSIHTHIARRFLKVTRAVTAISVLTGQALCVHVAQAQATSAPAPARVVANLAAASLMPDGENSAARAYWRSSRDGWFWYQDPPPDDDEVPPRLPAPVPAPSPLERDLAAHKAFQQHLENALNAAVVNPSEENLARFLETWAQARRKASLFTDRAQLLAARMPWVDETSQGTRPPNGAALRVFDQVHADQKDTLMQQLARTHGLYFFFRSDCPYCHAHAPMLRQLEEKYGFTVFPVSLDGKGIPMYPQPASDNGMSRQVMQALRIPEGSFQVPFTVLAEPRSRELLPVGFGPMTAAEMVDRIAMVLRSRGDMGALLDRAGAPQPVSWVPADAFAKP